MLVSLKASETGRLHDMVGTLQMRAFGHLLLILALGILFPFFLGPIEGCYKTLARLKCVTRAF